ncbi:MAG: FtsW/RodA/SpoVE family cell cycle protein, partial [Coriobacteriales bacterium]|nr:FtsW/RodA/SpoVE family cell cycle protein [Coriobacteriales bacterium]
MRSRRDTELWLLIAALPILVLLFAMLLINQRQDLTFSSFAVPLGLFAAFVLAHLTTRRFAPNADPALLPISFLLSGIGICFVMRLAPSLAMKQLCWLFLGIAAMVVTLILVRSLENLANYKYSVMIVGLLLLLLPAVIGTEIYGSKIWITFAGFSFQPGEIAKVLIVIFLAAYMAQNRELLSVSNKRFLGLQIPHLRTLAPLLIMWAIAMLIVVFERDLGSAMLVFGIFLIMLYVCSGRPAYVIAGALLVLLGLTAAYFCFDHVQVRMKAWLHPFDYPKDAGYQIIQATYSMADGGLFGTGIGRGMPTKIPVVASDFIFAAIAEEMGLLGAAGILIAFMLFAIRGFLTAARAKSDLAAFTATGLTTAIALQAFVIVGGITRVIPLTGLTLPFMSQGGSSLLASFIILALLLRAGHEGSGMGTELQGTVRIDGGGLGRVALGRRLTQLVTCFTVLFAVLIGALTWVQVVRADYYRNLPNNNHAIERNAQIERGSILTSDNVVLAQSVLSDDGITYERVYPQGDLAAHVVGYYSVQYGSAGIEAHENSELAGKTGTSSWSQAIGRMASGGTPGNDVMLTLDASVQQVAQDA